MKNIILVVVGIVVIAAGAVGYDMYGSPKLVPVKGVTKIEIVSLGIVPEFSFKTIDGREGSVSDFRGKVVILNFWATWCSTCVIEMPDMLNLVESYGGDVVFLALSSDMRVQSIEKFISGMKNEAKKIFDSENVYVALDDKRAVTYGIFMTDRYPETIIISPSGEMVRKIVGEFDWSSDGIKDYIGSLILRK